MKEPALLPQAWRLARRELRGGLHGFGVFLACLFLGVFAISSVGSIAASARAGLLADARALLGGDIEARLTHREIDADQRTFLEARGPLSQVVEMRAMARAPATEQRLLVELKAVDELYPLYGDLEIAPRASVAQALAPDDTGVHGALAESALLQRLDIQVGDRVRLGDAEVRISGVLVREPDRTLGAFTLGPRLLVSRAALTETGLLQPGSLVTFGYRLRLPADTVAEQVRAELREAFPDAGWRLRTWREAEPRVRDLIDRMSLNLSLVGLCALLVGGLGVAGAVRGYLGGKVFHIGAMKCVGAPGRVIFTGYLLQVLILGAVGATAGLAAGACVPWVAVRFFGEILPVPLQLGFHPLPLFTSALFGLLIALVFSLKALGVARRVPASVLFRGYAETSRLSPGAGIWCAIAFSAAGLALLTLLTSPDRRLALWFILGALACFAIFRGLSALIIVLARRAPRPSQPSLRLALANIHRRGSPAGSAVFSLGLGLTSLVIVVLVQTSLNRLVDETVPEEAPAFFFMDIQNEQVAAFEEALAEVAGVTRSERYPTLRGRITAIDGVPVAQARIAPEVRWAVRGDRFLSYSAEPTESAEVVAGNWWPSDYRGPPLLSLTTDVAEGFGVGVGDTLTVNVLGREITAEIANLRRVDWSTLDLNFALLFAPGTLEGAPHTHIATVYIAAEEETALLRAITDRFPNVSAIGTRDVLANVARTIERIGLVFQAVAAVALVTGFLVLAGALSADQHRRIHDAVIFKVCGATRRDILSAFAAEFLLLGLAAAAISALVGGLAAWGILEGLMNTPFHLSKTTVAMTLGLGLILTLILGLAGTWKALGQKPAVYLRED
ncbi:ABC transporter permease [Geoalkalibacter halelectricus]|uniref:FtsX-like permease family protein n=1 Tax=Geoalkalibacter halelectricus TaxID=2847045 RepID=A0ABY5ZQA2_9BACT|nr:FtsX-like permease family protein [Geoalkalibacter halelectricus]MDO3377573.1 FtsX-like permease family protein [Geoalkalibacter halelectricus]UWZ80669.1 FtsX-like permease family protein [Geoalkalibacter halelectricus]